MQQQGTPQVAKTVGMSEDCLHLNIYTPSIPGVTSTALLPVLVFIHGGSYLSGSGSSVSYEAMNLASRESLVVVSIEYRLGFLGFYPTGSNSSDSTTNQAMRDQIKALQWVQEEIRSFGGDPNQVTIYGQSAGATSVLSLLQTNATAGLFARAIADSPNLLPGWQRPEISQDLGNIFLNISGCNDADCLRYNRTSDQIITYQGQAFRQAQNTFPTGQINNIEPLRPFIDNDLITQDWDTALLSGAVNRVPTLISYNHDEYGAFLSLKSPVSFSTAENLLNTSLIGPERMQRILTTPELGFNTSLEDTSDGVDEALISFLTDFTYRCNSEIFAGYLQTVHPDVWEMTWEMGLAQLTYTPFCKPSTNRTCHGTELAMVFGSADYNNGLSTQQLSSIDYWQRTRDSLDLYGGFARQGTLTFNGTAYPRRGDNGTHNVLHWNDHPKVHTGGVNWNRCAKMQSMKLYDRLFYPYN
jgi:carboxylesterase type B